MPAAKRTTNWLGELLRAARFGFRPLDFATTGSKGVFIRLTPLGNDQYRLDGFTSGNHEFLENHPSKVERHVAWWDDEEGKQLVKQIAAPFVPEIGKKGHYTTTITES